MTYCATELPNLNTLLYAIRNDMGRGIGTHPIDHYDNTMLYHVLGISDFKDEEDKILFRFFPILFIQEAILFGTQDFDTVLNSIFLRSARSV